MYRTLRQSLCALPLFALLLTSANAAETAEPASPIDETDSGLSNESGLGTELIEPPNVDTGTAGTTSGITGADMDQEDETTGGGQSQGDAMFQTPASQSDDGPDYETESPEREETLLPDEPLGAADTGRREDGETQASSPQSPDEN